MTEPPSRNPDRLQPVALVLAFLLPGLGHAHLGERRRGVCIGVGVLSLFLGGLLIGGIDAVDRKEDFWWFIAQAGVGPVAVATDRLHQSMKVTDPATGTRRSPNPDENPRYTKSLGKINEIGALYCALAGLLNLIAMLDAGWRPDGRVRVVRARTATGGAA